MMTKQKQKCLEYMQMSKIIKHIGDDFCIEPGESPDFIISDGQQKIGIELTELVNQKIKTRIQKTINVISEARNIILSQENNFNCILYLTPNFKFDFDRSEKENLTNSLVASIKQLFENDIDINHSLICDYKIERRSRSPLLIEITEVFWDENINTSIHERIKSKKSKLPKYKEKKLDQYRLAIILRPGLTSPFDTREISLNEFNFNFEKVLIYDYFYDKLITLPNNPNIQ